MKIVIQRVKQASVTIDKKIYGSIGNGLLVFIGVGKEDTKEIVDVYVNKLIKMRIFEDKEGKTNLALSDVDGELLLVSQFTLYADCKKGNRPSFTQAGAPKEANDLYEYFVTKCREFIGKDKVKTGSFGADMEVQLLNNGPFTIILDENILR